MALGREALYRWGIARTAKLHLPASRAPERFLRLLPSVQSPAKQDSGHNHADQPNCKERPILRPEERSSAALQKAAAQYDQEVSQSVEQRNVLQCS